MFDWFKEKDPSEVHEHDFGKWEITKRTRVFDSDKDKYPLGTRTTQERTCKGCGFIEQHVGKII